MSFKELHWWLLFIIVLIIAVRAIFFFVAVPYNPVAQSRDIYLEIARNVVAGNGFSGGKKVVLTTTRGPVPVYFFAIVLTFFGDHTLSIALANWFVEAITGVLLFLIALELFGNRWIGLVSAVLFAFYGPSIFYAWQALSEPLFGLLLAAFVFSFLRVLRSPSIIGCVSAGIFLGAASLARPIMQYFLVVTLVILVWVLRSRGQEIIKWAAALTLAFVVVMTPWATRNYLIFGEFIPVSSIFGVPLYISNFTLDQPDFLQPGSQEDAEADLARKFQERFGPNYRDQPWWSQPLYDRLAKEETFKLVQQYPGRYLLLSTVRFFRLWYFIYGVEVYGTSSQVVVYLVLLNHGLLLTLAVIAFLYYRDAWWRRSLFLLTLILYYAAGYSIAHVQVRYIVPLVPYIMLFAAVTIVNILPQFHQVWSDKILPRWTGSKG